MSIEHGDTLHKRRIRLGLTQAELGERLGKPANTIARWERGEIPMRDWRMLFRALNDVANEVAAEQGEARRLRNEQKIALRDEELAAGHDP